MEYQLKSSLLPQKDNYTVIEQIFASRGIEPENINHYLHTSDQDIINPQWIQNIHEGAKMLIEHLKAQDKILIQIDSDQDGYTSAAVLYNYLWSLFPTFVLNNISYRIHEGKQHGIIAETIPADVRLVIQPDSSSNDYDVHAELRARGCDVLVIDHHKAEKVSEDACVINNQLCDYPNKSLSGVGMVYKFCCYLDSLLELAGHQDQYLDLVALGLTQDMMDLRECETKHLINKGLENIRNPFMKEMVGKQEYSINRAGGLCPFAVSFYIAPQVNGTIRMGTQEEKIMLFESMLDCKAYEQIPSTKRGCKGQYETRVEQACRNCTNIKNTQSKITESNTEIIESIIQNEHLTDNKIIAVRLPHSNSINRSLSGLIANQLVAKYQHPVLILSETISPTGELAWEGSARGCESSQLVSLRDFIRRSGYAYMVEGHDNAHGVGITESLFDKFINYSNKELENYSFDPCYKVDFIWNANSVNPKDIISIAELNSIWGQNLAQPKIAIENIVITANNITLMSKDKSPTLKIELPNGINLIKFKALEEEFNSLTKYPLGNITINIVGICKINDWNGHISPQIEITDYEITGESQYYF